MPKSFRSITTNYYRAKSRHGLPSRSIFYRLFGYRMLPLLTWYYRSLGYFPSSILEHRFNLSPDHFRFWRHVSSGTWEPWTLQTLQAHLNPDSVYCDIGAWIGPTVLYAARKCKRVFSFEPDPMAFRELSHNLALNRIANVQAFNLALTDRDGLMTMGSPNSKLGDSTTSSLHASADNRFQVLGLTWNTWMSLVRPEKPDMLKIDIEGGEFSLLPAMTDFLASTRPVLHLSTHADFLPAAQRREAMEKLLGAVRVYKNCEDELGRSVPLESLLVAETLDAPRAFLLTG